MKTAISLPTAILISTVIVSMSIFLVRSTAQETAALSQVAPNGHTAREEAAGQALWEKLQAEEMTCSDLSDDDFAALGEYFMGAMLGDSHEAMNTRMIQMMGEEGEEQMHAVLGKRMSSCEPDAQAPAGMGNMMPMMMGMGGGFMGGGMEPMGLGFNSFNNNSMMGYGLSGFGGGIFMILFWILVIVGIVALVKYTLGNTTKSGSSKSPLDILKERYAKGEIDRNEFEAKKKDL